MAAAKPKFIYATGRRKTSSARVYLLPKQGETASFYVNGKESEEYFTRPTTRMLLKRPLEIAERVDVYDIRVTVAGGGITGQAGAVVHGISRALQKAEPAVRPPLKAAGLMTRDPRVVERKKPGRHKARKRPQFSKR